jgi:hypothetical protein
VSVQAPEQWTEHRPVGGAESDDGAAGAVDASAEHRCGCAAVAVRAEPGAPIQPVRAPGTDAHFRMLTESGQLRVLERGAAAPAGRLLLRQGLGGCDLHRPMLIRPDHR